jgi:hypothetical protein
MQTLTPASYPGLRPHSTLFVGLYGELTLHPWWDPVAATSDAYSLFVARSSAMGWLIEAVENASGGVWGMNDAGQNPGSTAQRSYSAWFQVSVSGLLPADQPLPVQPFLACAGDVVARMGSLRLDAVQLLLPVQSLDASADASVHRIAVMDLIREAGWFADCNPQSSTRVRATLDGGQNPSIRSAAPGMLQQIQDIQQDVFVCDSFSLTDDAEVLNPFFGDHLWLGPPQHQVTVHGSLVEWSLDAVGWLAALLASASAQYGVSTPLLLTVSRFEGLISHND